MTLWDEIGAEIEAISLARGGPSNVYQPMLIEYYEHDNEVRVQLDSAVALPREGAS